MKKRNKKNDKTNEAILVKRPWYCFALILLPLTIEAIGLFLLLSDIEVEGIHFLYTVMIIAVTLMIWIIVDFICWCLIYSGGRFLIHKWYRKPKEYKKTEVKLILEYYSWPQRRTALVLFFADGKKIPINESYRGYKQFHAFLKKNRFPMKVVE